MCLCEIETTFLLDKTQLLLQSSHSRCIYLQACLNVGLCKIKCLVCLHVLPRIVVPIILCVNLWVCNYNNSWIQSYRGHWIITRFSVFGSSDESIYAHFCLVHLLEAWMLLTNAYLSIIS